MGIIWKTETLSKLLYSEDDEDREWTIWEFILWVISFIFLLYSFTIENKNKIKTCQKRQTNKEKQKQKQHSFCSQLCTIAGNYEQIMYF